MMIDVVLFILFLVHCSLPFFFFFNIPYFSFFFLRVLFIFIYLAVLGLCCCIWAISSCSEQGLLFIAMCRLLIAVASLVVEHRL